MSSLAVAPLYAQPGTATGNHLVGYGAVFEQWSRIATPKGAFMEKVARGAFTKTLAERGGRVRAILEHGQDARAGNRPLGQIISLNQDQYGLAYVVDLFNEGYVNELKSALAAGLYSSSFRFRSRVEDFEPRPPESAHNPMRLPEVVLRELDLFEVGPCTFPAYGGATAGLRSAGAAVPRLVTVPSLSEPTTVPISPRKRRSSGRGLWYIDPATKGNSWRL